jgi:hypothetical protein
MSLGDNKCRWIGYFYIATNITSYPSPYILIHHPLPYSSSMSLGDIGHKLCHFDEIFDVRMGKKESRRGVGIRCPQLVIEVLIRLPGLFLSFASFWDLMKDKK